MTTTGIMKISMAAMVRFQETWCMPWKLESASDSVWALGLSPT